MAVGRIVVPVEVAMAVVATRDFVLAAVRPVPTLAVVWYCFERALRSVLLRASLPLQPPSTSVPG